MTRQLLVRSFVAAASAVLAVACDNADSISSPRIPGAGGSGPGFRRETSTVNGPGPLLTALAANMCADVSGANPAAESAVGAPVGVWECHGWTNQRFALQPSGEITAYDGALCLDVAGGDANEGDPVIVWRCHGGPNQKWTRTAAGELRTAVNGKCLDVSGGRAFNGADLLVWSCHGGPNQKWTVNAVDSVPAVPPEPEPEPEPGPDTTTVAAAGAAAELPRATVDTRMPAPTGRTISVAAGGDLQGALNAAQPGDVVVLAPGATFVGNFVLPVKANAAGRWITVRSGGTLPAEGTRVRPADAAQMPKLLTPNTGPALATAAGTQGWRLVGLEVGPAAGSPWAYHLVTFGDGNGPAQTSLAQIPRRLVLDRSYVHGTPTYDLRRCVALHSIESAVVDSHLGDCHSNQADSQGIYGGNGPGPYKVENNYIEGGHEVVFFGGQTPGITGLLPSDIEIRRNHITRPMAWRGVWRAKNLFELKAAQRVLFEGNVLENNWHDAQVGFAVLLQTLSDENTMPWVKITDVTMRNNVIRNTPQGVNLLARVAYGGPLPAQPMARVAFQNNVVVLDASLNGAGRMVQLLSDLRDVTIAHNTFVDARGAVSNSALSFDDGGNIGPAVGLRVLSNAFGPAQWSPVMGNGTAGALTTLAKFAPDAVLSGNVFVGGNPGQFPQGNYFPGTLAEAGLSGAAAGSYQLTASYPGAPGADAAAVTAATRGVAP